MMPAEITADRLNSLYCIPLADDERKFLRERLHATRVLQVESLLASVFEPEVAERLGPRMAMLQEFLSEIIGLSGSRPERFRELLDHWATSFLLTRLLQDDIRTPECLDALLNNLIALPLCQRLDAESSDADEASYTTTADAYCLLRDAELVVHGAANGHRWRWRFSRAGLTVRPETGDGPELRVPLPVGGDGPVALRPLPRPGGWRMPVIAEIGRLGLEEFRPHPGDSRYAEAEPDGKLLALGESLGGSYAILQRLWPEVLDWAHVLVPAFVDMGGPGSKSVHRSASYGAGSPIFLTRVEDPLDHAEDVVHELQHERLYLLLHPGAFTGWDDRDQRFVSPYRTDPRPLRGLLLGVHAFVAVNHLRLRALAERPSPERVYALLKTHLMNLFTFRTLLEHATVAREAEALFAEIAAALSDQHPRVAALAEPGMQDAFERILRDHVGRVAAAATVVNADPAYRNWDETVALAAGYAARVRGS